MAQRYWLMKSEPDVYSIEHLKRDRSTTWEGVRNYMARNFMVNDMKPGDKVLFYHSNAKPSGVAGIAEVTGEPEPDRTQFDKKSDYYDPKSTAENPRWRCVRVRYVETLPELVSLDAIKGDKNLADMVLLQNSRLSVQPVTKPEYEHIIKLSKHREA